MDHHQFIFENISEGHKEMLIALLNNIGFVGFEEENNDLKAFAGIDNFNQELFDNIIYNMDVKYIQSTIKETNWNEKWESGFQPVTIYHPVSKQAFAVVRADFHKSIRDAQYDLVITPKMSFGTGHHATTHLMIEQMSLLDFNGKQVIDFGTGTGILAILAEKMGASNVTAIDNDDWSISNATENTAANFCRQNRLLKADTILTQGPVDIILANINLNILIANMNAVSAAARPGATLVFSGLLLQDAEKMKQILPEHNLILQHSFSKDNWVVMVIKKN